MAKKMKWYLGLIIAVGVFFIELPLIPKTGMSWDEPSSFFFGRANLKFYQTGNRAYITDVKNKTLFADSPFGYIYGEDQYPPFAFVVASLTSSLLAEKLHWLSVIDAHHVGEVFIGVVGIAAFYGVLVELTFSGFIAAATTLLYAFYPTIFGQMRSDAKDIPLMSMMTIAVYFFLKFFHTRRLVFAFLFSLTFGMAIATKPTALILLPILGIWMIKIRNRPPAFLLLLCSLISLAVSILLWSWLWDDIWGKILIIWTVFKTVGLGMPVLFFGELYNIGFSVPHYYPLAILSIQTPPALLVLAGIGMVFAITKPAGRLFSLWFFIGMGRFFIPGVLVFWGIRHFIDVLPAFFGLVAVGLSAIHQRAKTRFGHFLFGVGASALVAHELFILYKLAPYEPNYFNSFVGGIGNVAAKGLFDASYWGTEVKEAMEFINTHYGGRAKVYPCELRHLAYFYTDGGTQVLRESADANVSIVPNAPSWYWQALDYYRTNEKLVYTVRRDTADLMYVFERTKPQWFRCRGETVSNYE